MDIHEYRRLFAAEDSAPGWDAIDAALAPIYGDQQPKHWAPAVYASLGGEDPLDGVSLYRSGTGAVEHLHFVTYGFSQLYFNEESVGAEFSKFGFELTFRLKPFKLDAAEPTWVVSMLQNLARYVFKSGRWFNQFDYLDAKGPIRLDTETAITALAFCVDPQLGVIETPHGQVQFIQAYGITTAEYEELKKEGGNAERLFAAARKWNSLFITDLERKCAV